MLEKMNRFIDEFDSAERPRKRQVLSLSAIGKEHPKPGRGVAIEKKPVTVTPGLYFRRRYKTALPSKRSFHVQAREHAIEAAVFQDKDFVLLQALSEAWPTGFGSHESSQRAKFRVSHPVSGAVLERWSSYAAELKSTLQSKELERFGLQSLRRYVQLDAPSTSATAKYIEDRVVQLIETIALGRQQAGLTGPYPITHKGEFVAEIRHALLALFPISSDQAAQFLQGIREDLISATKSNTLHGKWGALVFDGELTLDVAPRGLPEHLKTEPHLSTGWRPAQR
jgi:hypothetical protein